MSPNRLLHHLRDFIRRQGGGSGVADGQLLERFLTQRDETAFEVLVWRHGPMVLALGRRVLGNAHDAEDVLQATFLTLVRKGGAIGKSASLSSWLYKVAYRIALRLQARTVKTLVDGRLVEDVPARPEPDESVWHELRPLLDAAIERLPEKYRTAIVLCDLQGKTYREAAEQLGCTASAISTRVTRARQLLRKRLAHHGLSVTLGVLSAALAQRTATAMPAPLTTATVRAAAALLREGSTTAIVSASVAELIQGANPAMSLTRFHIVVFLAVAAGSVAVGAGILAHREPPIASAEPPPAAAKAPAEKPAATVTVRGRVLGPDGKPVTGARLYFPRLRKMPPRSEDDIEYPQRSKTDAEGRFRFEMLGSDIHADFRMNLIATADGYGTDWMELSADNPSAELTLRLVKDQLIEGRIISTEGKPLTGIRVGIVSLSATHGKLDPFLNAWKQNWGIAFQEAPKRLFVPINKVLSATTTDKEGRFRLAGGGVERVAVLEVRGPGISQGSLHVIGRDGFDPSEINKVVIGRMPMEERRFRQPPQLYGPKFTFVAESSRRIEGTVREVGSGKPIAGVSILTSIGHNNPVMAFTDKDGRYHLDGLPKMKEYVFVAWPPANSSWLRSGARAEDKEGLQPITVDFVMARGIVVSGRVIDRTTGKGVKGSIHFVALPGNKFADKQGYDSYKHDRLSSDVGADGRFKLPVMPGPIALVVQASGREKANGGQQLNPYTQAEFEAKDREHVKVKENGDDRYFANAYSYYESMTFLNGVKVLDLAADAGIATCDLFLDRGQTMTVKIEDMDGKPRTGTTVAGATAPGWDVFPLKDAACTVFALDPKKPRRVLFFHAERNLAGSLTVRGDEKEPPVVHLGPTGSVMGRILDRDGQPLAGAAINLDSPERSAGELYRRLRQRQPMIRTDKDGRFRIEGIVPDVKFSVGITHGRTFFVGEPRIGVRQVKPGETLNLGDVRVKPGP